MSAFSSFVTQTWFLVCAAFFAGLAIGMWADAILRRRDNAGVADGEIRNVLPLLYVGEMTVSDRHLADDLYLEIAARGFNATTEPVTIGRVDGHITCRSEQLPRPNMLTERGPRDGIIPAKSEFIVVLEQRMPKLIAEQLSSLPAGERIPLNMDKLVIKMALASDSSKETRLPIYDGMMLYREHTRLLVSRIINARGSSIVVAGNGRKRSDDQSATNLTV